MSGFTSEPTTTIRKISNGFLIATEKTVRGEWKRKEKYVKDNPLEDEKD